MKHFDSKAIAEFARYYGFHYDTCDPASLVQDVLFDMERGLRGQHSSLPMIPSYLSPVQAVPLEKNEKKGKTGKKVIALDAGGTNFRAALVHFDDAGKAVAEHTEKAPMPGTYGRVTVEQFFDQIADLAAPLLEKNPAIEGMGFCFSYPTEINKDADGRVLSFSKEVDAPEVVGTFVVQGLRDALQRRGLYPPEHIVLLNDTVATLLSGLIEMRNAGDGPAIGAILGTGYNTAYPERCIPKIGFESAEKPQIVVCETGTFAYRYQGYLDKEFDRSTKNPGTYLLEKACAGAYLGPLTFRIMRQAIEDGVLAFKKADEFLAWTNLQTKDLNAFLRNPLASESPVTALFAHDEAEVRSAVVYLASIITERAALLAAAPIAAAVRRVAHYDPLSPVRIAIEGTTYLIYQGMRGALDSWLHVMLAKEKPHPYIITPVDQASLFGAAVAALKTVDL
jgi:hexokinase